jgi:hypothetical protein
MNGRGTNISGSYPLSLYSDPMPALVLFIYRRKSKTLVAISDYASRDISGATKVTTHHHRPRQEAT